MTHEPIDDVLKALRDELAGVAPSPEFASRVRERVAGELPLLREELAAVAPSPEFRARVRQRIEAAGPARGAGWLSGWRWLMPLAAAAGVAIAVAIMSRGSKDVPAPVTITAGRSDGAVVARPSTETPRPTASDRRTASRTAASLLRSSKVEVRSSKAKPAEGPSMEVITNQPAVLKAMWARVAGAPTLVETTPLPEAAPEIVVPPIEVNPIVVKSMIEQPREGGGLLPIVRIITAQ
jgi:hypothetical protein